MYNTGAYLEITGRRGWSEMLEGVAGEVASAAPGASPADVANAIRAVLATPQFQASVQQPSSYPGGGLAYGGQPRVVERPLSKMREYPLGFFQSGIGPGTGNIEITSRPQVTFRGERLVIPTAVAALFSLNDIKVGNISQLVNSTQLPAEMFQENAIGIRLALDTANIAMDITLAVQNTSMGAATFRAAIVGTVAQ